MAGGVGNEDDVVCEVWRGRGDGPWRTVFLVVSEPEKYKNLEEGAEEALLAAEDGAEEIIPKNDVYAALWAMLDAESENEAEEIPGQWDLDDILNNWGMIELDMGPTGNDQGPSPVQFSSLGRRVFCSDSNMEIKR
ncbi:hypothetical protein PIB30_092667, partial [Stylosanthes scabra]|nr:hypothetical protein [Stylosanthes scabra]